jgi:hypothetical protein
MATVLTPEQKLANSWGTHTFTLQGDEVVISGKRGILSYLGLAIDAVTLDAEDTGVQRTIQRGSYRKSRWLGDTNGPTVGATTVSSIGYPTSSGNAKPGKPFSFTALTDKGGHPTLLVTGTLSIQGPWGRFIQHMLDDRPPHSVRFTTPSGAVMRDPILSAADLD